MNNFQITVLPFKFQNINHAVFQLCDAQRYET